MGNLQATSVARPAHSFPSDAICKRRPVGYAGLWFRGNFAFGWFTDLPDRPRVLLVQPPRARPRPSPQLRVLPGRKPPSSRSWQLLALPPWPLRARPCGLLALPPWPLRARPCGLLALPPWPLRARPCGRLHAPPSSPPRVARVRQPRSSLSQRLRALPASPPRARLFAQRRAPPSRQLYASLARWLRASPSLLPRASPAAQLRAGLSPRRQALLARLRLRDPWPLAWPF